MSLFTNPKRAKQLLDFSGLKTPNSPIFPTDIDGLIELWDKGYFIIEIKYNGKEVPFGQRLALERMAVDFYKAGKVSLVVVADHYVADPEEMVSVADCIVRGLYWGQEAHWEKPDKNLVTVKDAQDLFIEICKRVKI